MSDAADRQGLDVGVPGASARDEYHRRRARREQRTLERHPRVGSLLLAVQAAPRHERAWERGAIGEERVAAALDRRLGDRVVLLHDRRIPASRANVDHLAIAPSGVWVIDTKRYKGRVAVVKPLFGRARLTIAGRDKTSLVAGVRKQVAIVEGILAELGPPDAAVHGTLCFVDAELPLLRTLTFDGCSLLRPRALAKRIERGPAALLPARVDEVARHLARRLPAA